jgi:isoamylase
VPQYRQPESSTKAETTPKDSDVGDGTTHSASSQPSWIGENIWTPVQENVLNPMANGTGAVRIYNTFAPADRQAKEAKVAEVHNVAQWGVQTLSETAGAIVPYVIAGKLLHGSGRLFGETIGAKGVTARILSHEAGAQIVGAGMYDFIKKPNQGETRVSNSVATMASFTVFEGGNRLIKAESMGLLARTSGRAVVGAGGGMVGYDTSHLVAGMMGETTQTNWSDRAKAMASGAFINTSLPAISHGLTRAYDAGINSQPWGKGIPIERYLKYEGLNHPELAEAARFNPLARVKEVKTPGAETKADVAKNVVELQKQDSAAKLAHELTHLRLAKQMEPLYSLLEPMSKANPAKAEQDFYKLRAFAESTARATENKVLQRMQGPNAPQVVEHPALVGEQLARDGRQYKDIWAEEWKAFVARPDFRPKVEFHGVESSGAVSIGSPEPLGATVTEHGVNFAVASESAQKVELLIFENKDAKEPSRTIELTKTDNVWHGFVENLSAGVQYLFRAHGEYSPARDGSRINENMALLDPYSKAVSGGTKGPLGYDNSNPSDANRHLKKGTTDSVEEMPRSIVVKAGEFDWQGDKPPNIDMADSHIYEANLRGMTAADQTLGAKAGTYLGLLEKIEHLKKLNVTAVELMPIMQFDKADWPHNDPVTGEPLGNSWGYNTVAFQAPEGRFAMAGSEGAQVAEFKTMVRELHKNNIEVILDIVFNHTREAGHMGPTISFKGFDNKVYYMLVPGHPELYVDHTGCGNTMNTNHPQVQKMILDTLRYWKEEMHVDGFRFDLATIFNYDVNGAEKAKTPIIEAMENDPILKGTKLIAEAWGPHQYKLGHFSEQRWSEWNGDFRDTVRKFIKGDTGQTGTLAERIKGSPKWFRPESGRYSVNFVTAHDGYTLNDLVSYQQKHNHANGENNNDGSNDNFSWNHGVEGPVERSNLPLAEQQRIEQLRVQQVKNALALLYLSKGTPMLLYGDEMRRSQNGNNNAWPQDKLTQLDWMLAEKNKDVLRFTQMITELRKQHGIGRVAEDAITWHGTKPYQADFSDGARFIAWQYGNTNNSGRSLYQAFNAYWEPLDIVLPPGNWHRRVDTGLPAGQDIVPSPTGQTNQVDQVTTYRIQPRTGIVFESH